MVIFNRGNLKVHVLLSRWSVYRSFLFYFLLFHKIENSNFNFFFLNQIRLVFPTFHFVVLSGTLPVKIVDERYSFRSPSKLETTGVKGHLGIFMKFGQMKRMWRRDDTTIAFRFPFVIYYYFFFVFWRFILTCFKITKTTTSVVNKRARNAMPRQTSFEILKWKWLPVLIIEKWLWNMYTNRARLPMRIVFSCIPGGSDGKRLRVTLLVAIVTSARAPSVLVGSSDVN